MDSNHRPSGYEPDELPLLHAASPQVHGPRLPGRTPVPSALRCFTARFEMERGGSSALNTHLLVVLSSATASVCLFLVVSVCAARVAGIPRACQAIPDQASPRSSVLVTSTRRRACSASLSYRLFLPGPYQPYAARRLVLQWASHLDAFSGSPSRP